VGAPHLSHLWKWGLPISAICESGASPSQPFVKVGGGRVLWDMSYVRATDSQTELTWTFTFCKYCCIYRSEPLDSSVAFPFTWMGRDYSTLPLVSVCLWRSSQKMSIPSVFASPRLFHLLKIFAGNRKMTLVFAWPFFLNFTLYM